MELGDFDNNKDNSLRQPLYCHSKSTDLQTALHIIEDQQDH